MLNGVVIAARPNCFRIRLVVLILGDSDTRNKRVFFICQVTNTYPKFL
jgi:hypothetical protein